MDYKVKDIEEIKLTFDFDDDGNLVLIDDEEGKVILTKYNGEFNE